MKRLIIAGGSGYLGRVLSTGLQDRYEIVILSRSKLGLEHSGIKHLCWAPPHLGEWEELIDGAYAVINLAGKSVDCRYNVRNKEEILQSRIYSTRLLSEVIDNCKNPPKVWINASSATIYESEYEKDNTEERGTIGDDFSMNVVKSWETEFYKMHHNQTRKIALRMGIVIGEKAPVYQRLNQLVRWRVGGKMGSGDQFVSWIHDMDLLRIINHMLEDDSMEGTYNCVAPNFVTNSYLMRSLRKLRGISFGLDSPEWLLRIGTFVCRTEAELVLKSRRVRPKRLLDSGFRFEFPRLKDALLEIRRKEINLEF